MYTEKSNKNQGGFELIQKIGFISLGCDKNLVDSEFMLGTLKNYGFTFTNDAQEADAIIINTCGFIDAAKQESIDTILEMAQYKKKGKLKYLIVTGCLAQRYKETIYAEIPEVDVILGVGEFNKIGDVLSDLDSHSRVVLTSNSSFIDYDLNNRVSIYPYISFVKISEGCDNRCSYCSIPYIRGPYKSRPIHSIKQEVEKLVSQGIKEVNLVAQDTTNYGIDIFGKPSLPTLLKELDQISGDFWIRILYAYPNNVNQELLEILKRSSKIVNYLDIPLQHINDRILKLMNRPTNGTFIKKLIERIKTTIPDISIRTTFIVGFPTESDEEFQELVDFIKAYELDNVGVFKYSREENTPAYNIKPQVSKKVMNKRYNEIMTVQKIISKNKNERLIGTITRMLVESYDKERNLYLGRCWKDAPFVDGLIKLEANNCKMGEFYNVRITNAFPYDLSAKVII